MSPETEHKLARVRKYSAQLRALFKLLFAVTALGGLFALIVVFMQRNGPGNLNIAGRIFSGDEITPLIRIVAVIGIGLTFSLALKLTYHLIRLFDLYARGQIFTADDVREIRQIGISVFLFVLLWVFDLIAQLLVHSVPTAEGTAGISINIGGMPFGLAIAGIIIMIVSWIMDVGRELREEQDLTV